MQARFSLLNKYIQHLGFEGASYTVVPDFVLNNTFKKGPIFLVSDEFPYSFIDQYSTDRFDKIDFTISRIKANQFSTMDWKLYRNSTLLSDAEKNVLHIAEQDHGIINALSIPTMAGIKGVSGVSVISKDNDHSFGLLKKERQATLEAIIDVFHKNNLGFEDYFVKSFLSEFSDKEILILKHLASGRLMKNIKHETGISVSYAANILSDLRKKLGNATVNKIMYEIDYRYFD